MSVTGAADDPGPVGPPVGPLLCIVGPTATGKSELAVAVAERVGGEIVNADASQLYRGMDIGTAKLPSAARRGVSHHLLDVLDVTEEASVAAYQRAARSAIAAIAGGGRLPVLVGGSGLYVSAVLDRLVFPGTDPLVRSRLEAELAEDGPGALHARLAALDPAAAAAILPGNGRRIVRALEVIELTGRPFVATLPASVRRPAGVTVLRTEDEPGALDARIAARVDAMWAAGLVGEVRNLIVAGLRNGRTASRALGYAQVLAMLDGPDGDPAGDAPAGAGRVPDGAARVSDGAARVSDGAARVSDGAGVVSDSAAWVPDGAAGQVARMETVRATRRFARRQRSWFARERTARACPVGPDAIRIALSAAQDCLRVTPPSPGTSARASAGALGEAGMRS